jgi:nucleotide-binding universal stress UspA family protein
VTSTHLSNQENPHVLIAFDGSFSAGRALHMAILLGILKDKTLHIASVSENEKQARYHVDLAAKLCHAHGLKVHLHPIASAQKPSMALLELMEDLKPSLVIMGAYNHGGLRAFFMGSCSRDLLKETDVPLFMFH